MLKPGYLLVVIFLLSLITRGAFLTMPQEVVFDEVHFGKFITAYCCTGENFFDIHPPHGKLLIAGAAWLVGYRGGFDFANIGQPYGENVSVVALRLLPMLVGALLPVIIFILLRQLGATAAMAGLGGLAVAFDNALVVQSRLISLDMILLVATFGALSLWLAADSRFSRSSVWWWFAAAGAAAGLAAGTKFTGLAILGLLGGLTLVKIWQERNRPQQISRWVLAGVVVLGGSAITYGAGWAVHWSLLALPGTGDAFYQAGATPGLAGFFTDTYNLHRVMLSANYNLTATHPYASVWWQWPLLARPVFYWQGSDTFIYLLGNPAVWWGSTLLFVTALIAMVVRFGRRQRITNSESQITRSWIPLLGYGIAMFPFIRIPRALFLYHYFTPLLLALLVGLLWLDGVVTQKQRRLAVVGSTVIIVATFFWFSPLTYGLPVRPDLQGTLFWFRSWR